MAGDAGGLAVDRRDGAAILLPVRPDEVRDGGNSRAVKIHHAGAAQWVYEPANNISNHCKTGGSFGSTGNACGMSPLIHAYAARPSPSPNSTTSSTGRASRRNSRI